AGQYFDRLVGGQHEAGAIADAVCFESRGDVGDGAVKRAEADRDALIEIDNGELVRIATAILCQQVGDRLVRNLRLMLTKHIRHRVSSLLFFYFRCTGRPSFRVPASAAAPSPRISGAFRNAPPP